MVAGKPVLVSLGAGSYALSDAVIDGAVAASELTFAGEDTGEAPQLDGGDATVLAVSAGAPRVRLERLQLLGQVKVAGGDVAVSNCSFGESSATARRRLSGATPARALVVGNGTAALDGVVFEGLGGGAIEVAGGSLTVTGGELRRNSAARGGAMLVTGGEVRIEGSSLEDNTASESGGALFVAGGRVVLGNQTSLRGNSAPKSEGKAIYSVVDLSYELPSPLATWVLTGGGSISSLGAGYIDDDFPYDCAPTRLHARPHVALAVRTSHHASHDVRVALVSAGVLHPGAAGLYGDSFSTFDQSGPHCSGSCPAGEYCEKRTTIPAVCAAGAPTLPVAPDTLSLSVETSLHLRRHLLPGGERVACRLP